jgi:glycosyltransferase involved in cell wall biosynthesis
MQGQRNNGAGLRILMLLHVPWSRNLGGARVQLELAEEFTKFGCQVEKFDWHDAFPWHGFLGRISHKAGLLTSMIGASFATKSKAYVRKYGTRFDIIDCHQGNLPFSKQKLDYVGLLVCRSVGLYAFYDQFAEEERKLYPSEDKPSNLLKTTLHRLREARTLSLSKELPRSFAAADLINLPNEDERRYVTDVMRYGEKCMVQPFGLSTARLAAFRDQRLAPHARLAAQEVVFIGAWGSRKGSRDWPHIVSHIKKQVPAARFKFLGTGVPAERVLSDLRRDACNWINVVPSYEAADLPNLLRDSTVGAFPSYIEGFGFAVLEKLAAGLPVVAYDVPGPRAMLKALGSGWMTVCGNAEGFASAVANFLTASLEDYLRSASAASNRAMNFTWDRIARDTLAQYRQSLVELTRMPAHV